MTNKVPNIRFKGFTDDWEQRKLGEVGTAKSGVGFPDAEQGGIEGIPFFKVSDMNIEGNENELVVANNYVTAEQINRKKWNVINDVPAIFFAKVGAAVMLNRKRLVRFPFLLDNNTMAYVFNKNVWNCDFGKTLFETLDLTKLTQVGALPSYNASDVENVRINIPNKNEQQKIGEYFSNLDHLITLHQRKCEQTKELKKFMLQKMFPKKGEKNPEIRFQGFTDDWEQRKLGEFADIVTGKLDANAMKEDGEYDFYTSGIQKYKIDVPAFEGPAITIAGNGATVGYMHLADGKFNAYQRTYVLSAFQANRKFLFYEIGNKLPQKIAQEARTGNIPYIVMDMLTDLQIFIPPEHEQSKIGEFFSNLDRLITLHQRKCEQLKELKKFMLQNMFPKKG